MGTGPLHSTLLIATVFPLFFSGSPSPSQGYSTVPQKPHLLPRSFSGFITEMGELYPYSW